MSRRRSPSLCLGCEGCGKVIAAKSALALAFPGLLVREFLGGGQVNINDSVVSQDGALKATLTAFNPKTGQGRLKIEELKAERGRFYVTVTYGEAGQTRIDYKTYDLKKASEYPFATNRGDAIKEITIVRVPAD
jgi:hypothetical protein